jgi:carboxyl-terminal processing protease
MYNFSANSASDFRNALRVFVKSESTKLLLDLRGNPGGYLESAIDIASWFLPTGKVIVQEDFGSGGEIKLMRSKGYNIFDSGLKMVILVDKGSASASEIVAGALQEHNVATLVGENTFGKGSVQELIEIDGNTSLKVTIARWLTPSGKSISDGGLIPDILISELPEEYRGNDWEVLSGYEKYSKLNNYQKDEAIKLLKNN